MMLGLRFNKYRDMDLYVVYKAAKERRNYSYLVKEILRAYIEHRAPVVPVLNLMDNIVTPEDPKIAATCITVSDKYDSDIIDFFETLQEEEKIPFIKFLMRVAMIDALTPLYFNEMENAFPIVRAGQQAMPYGYATAPQPYAMPRHRTSRHVTVALQKAKPQQRVERSKKKEGPVKEAVDETVTAKPVQDLTTEKPTDKVESLNVADTPDSNNGELFTELSDLFNGVQVN